MQFVRAGSSGSEGTHGDGHSGSARREEKEISGELQRGRGPVVAMSGCVSVAERKGRSEGEHRAALIQDRSRGTGVSGCRPRTCSVHRTESAGRESEADLNGSWCDKCPVEDPVPKTALRQAARPSGPAVRRTWD